MIDERLVTDGPWWMPGLSLEDTLGPAGLYAVDYSRDFRRWRTLFAFTYEPGVVPVARWKAPAGVLAWRVRIVACPSCRAASHE